MRNVVSVIIGVLLNVGLAQAQGKAFDWSDCKIEVTKHCKALTDNEKIYLCLEQHDSELSDKCEAIHAKYEALTGRKKAK